MNLLRSFTDRRSKGSAMPLLHRGRWWFYTKLTLIRLLCVALVLGYGLALSVRYGPVVAWAAVAAAVGLVVLVTWFSEHRKTARVRRLFAGKSFPVKAGPPLNIASANTDGWLLLRGARRGIAVDVANQLLWVLFNERNIHALLPTAIEGAEIHSEHSLFGRERRILQVRAPAEPRLRFEITEGDELSFTQALGRLLERQNAKPARAIREHP